MNNPYTTHFPSIYRGKVENNTDPEGLGRCRVSIFQVYGNCSPELLPWARPIVASPVSKDRGSFNLPDIGDIVWVFFEGGDKEYPLYLGGTYGKGDIKIEPTRVDIYTENDHRLSYDRVNHSYSINVGDHGLLIDESGITLYGNIKLTGNLEVVGTVFTEAMNNGESMNINPLTAAEKELNVSSDGVPDNTPDNSSSAVGNPGTADFSAKASECTGGRGINRLSDSEAFCSSLIEVIEVTCRDENGATYQKRLSVNKYISSNIKSIFDEIYNSTSFCVRAADTGAYNYRKINGKNKLSYHSYGVAIDLNWNLNPYSSSAEGSDDNLRLRTMNHPVVKIFQRHGWGWGGSYEDHMHFSYFNGY